MKSKFQQYLEAAKNTKGGLLKRLVTQSRNIKEYDGYEDHELFELVRDEVGSDEDFLFNNPVIMDIISQEAGKEIEDEEEALKAIKKEYGDMEEFFMNNYYLLLIIAKSLKIKPAKE